MRGLLVVLAGIVVSSCISTASLATSPRLHPTSTETAALTSTVTITPKAIIPTSTPSSPKTTWFGFNVDLEIWEIVDENPDSQAANPAYDDWNHQLVLRSDRDCVVRALEGDFGLGVEAHRKRSVLDVKILGKYRWRQFRGYVDDRLEVETYSLVDQPYETFNSPDRIPYFYLFGRTADCRSNLFAFLSSLQSVPWE